MNKKFTQKPLAAALGAAFLTTVSASAIVEANENPFTASQLSSGYMQIAEMEGKCGEGKCGAKKKAKKEGKCGEGKCGGEKKVEKEGKCGEGKCGGAKKAAPKAKEGKCGEGKCGGKK